MPSSSSSHPRRRSSEITDEHHRRRRKWQWIAAVCGLLAAALVALGLYIPLRSQVNAYLGIDASRPEGAQEQVTLQELRRPSEPAAPADSTGQAADTSSVP
jgi:hypothetical protein